MDLDLSKYEGHTPGPWECDPNDVTWIRTEGEPYGPYGNMHVADLRGWGHLTGVGACGMDPSDAEPIHNANARLIADAPLLLAEVRRLREENEQQRKTIERYAQWDAQRQRNVDLAAQLAALRRSHARLLAALLLVGRVEKRAGVPYYNLSTPYLIHIDQMRELGAAVAEAEAL